MYSVEMAIHSHCTTWWREPYHPLFFLGCLSLTVIFCITVFGTEHLNPKWMSVMGGRTEKWWIYQFGTFSSHLFKKKTKCLKLKVALKRKIYKQNVYDLPLGCCQIYSRALWELFFLFYKPLENEIYVAPIHKRCITYHTVPILEP